MKTEKIAFLSLNTIILILILLSAFCLDSMHKLKVNTTWVNHTRDVIITLKEGFSNLQDAETNARGYIITGDEKYYTAIAPVVTTSENKLKELQKLTIDNSSQQKRINRLDQLYSIKIAQLNQALRLKKQGNDGALKDLLFTGVGNKAMDGIRAITSQMQLEEERLLQIRTKANESSFEITVWLILFAGIFSILLVIVLLIFLKKDLKKHRLTEEKLKESDLFFNISLDMLCIASDSQFIKINPAFMHVLGFEEAELIGRPFLSFVHPDDVQSTLDEVAKLQKGETTIYFENRYRCKDNSYKWLAWTSSPDVKTNRLYAVAHDISENKRIEEELRKSKELAEKLAGSKDQFLANMSHEIRTPLNGIIGFTKVLLRNVLTEKQRQQMEAIKVSSDILMVLINDILDLAKIEAGHMAIEYTEMKLDSIMSMLFSSFELRLEEKIFKVTTHYDTRIPKILLGDPIRINQVLINLLSNAIKFTPHGGSINVNVNLVNEDADQALIEFIISDTGIGIPTDKLATIFDPFIQSSLDTARKYGGTGLGLSIVKRLVELMHGTISVKSQVNKGSEFIVKLPLKKTNATEVSNDIEKKLYHEELLQLGKIRVLLAEDIPVNQFLAKTILADFGFESDTAENGKIAIELLEKNDYDIILMDLMMPEMSGLEATQHIRTKMSTPKSNIPIIALTADVGNKDMAKCKEAGMNEFVSKPINEKELLNKIVQLVKKPGTFKVSICNLEYLKSHGEKNPAFLPEILPMIIKNLTSCQQELNTAIADSNWTVLHGAIHKVRSSLGMIGMPESILQLSRDIEGYARDKEHLDKIPQLAKELSNSLQQGCKELEDILEKEV
jgi:PAS domain S-box-containing protein